MIASGAFAIRRDSEGISGMTIEIGCGPQSMHGRTAMIEISDIAFSFIEPILVRCAPVYHPDTRFGIGEFDRAIWNAAVGEFRALADRLRRGEPLSLSDVAWIHTVDVDAGTETTAEDFLSGMSGAENRQALYAFLGEFSEWIEEHLPRHDIITVYGY